MLALQAVAAAEDGRGRRAAEQLPLRRLQLPPKRVPAPPKAGLGRALAVRVYYLCVLRLLCIYGRSNRLLTLCLSLRVHFSLSLGD